MSAHAPRGRNCGRKRTFRRHFNQEDIGGRGTFQRTQDTVKAFQWWRTEAWKAEDLSSEPEDAGGRGESFRVHFGRWTPARPKLLPEDRRTRTRDRRTFGGLQWLSEDKKGLRKASRGQVEDYVRSSIPRRGKNVRKSIMVSLWSASRALSDKV